MRSSWKGGIPLTGMLTLQVEAFKATEKYAGDESLKTVCSHPDPQPFERKEVCVHGEPRLTTDGIKNGKTGTLAQMAAVRPDGSYAPIPKAELSAIDAAVNSDEIEPLALVDEWAEHTVDDLWFLAPNKKVQGSLDGVALFYAYLEQNDKVLIGRWATRGRQHIVAIHAADGVLCMNRLRYAQEVREPEDAMRAVGRAQVDAKMMALMDAILEDLPTAFSVAEVQDESVTRKAQAVQKALAGELAAVTTPVANVEDAGAPDLMAALTAAVAEKGGAKKGGKAAKPAKEKVVA